MYNLQINNKQKKDVQFYVLFYQIQDITRIKPHSHFGVLKIVI